MSKYDLPVDGLIARAERAEAERDRYREALVLIASPNRATYDKDGSGAWQIATDALRPKPRNGPSA